MQSVTQRWAGWGHRPCPGGGHPAQNSRYEQPHVHVQDTSQKEHGQGQEEDSMETPVGQRKTFRPHQGQGGAGTISAPPSTPPSLCIHSYGEYTRTHPRGGVGGPGVGDLRPRKGLNHQTLPPSRAPSCIGSSSAVAPKPGEAGGQRMGRGQLMGPEQGPLGDCGLTETHELRTPGDTSGEGLRGGTSYNSIPGGREGPHER